MKEDKTYRINGFEQIKAFYSWVFNNPDKARPTHISLYLFLINQANRANWAEWFKCPYDLAMQGACIGNNGTYYKCLDDLKNWNLIDYKKGINNYKAPLINLICLYDNEQLTEQVTVPLSEQQTAQQYVQLTEQLPVHIYKLLTNNLKRITDNLPAIINFLDGLNPSKELNVPFETFWFIYDKKEDKIKCERKWANLTNKEREDCIKSLTSYIQATPDKQFRKNPATYLNNKSWENEIIKPVSKSGFKTPAEEAEELIRMRNGN